jgi:hypothetical protein
MPNEQSSYSEAVAYVLRALEQSSQPLAVTKLGKAIPKSALKSKKDLPDLLEQMVKAGQIRVHKARSSLYWLPSLEDLASERILEAFDEKPLTKTDLNNKFRSLLPRWPTAKRKEMVAQLVKSGRIRAHKSSLYWLPSLEDLAFERIFEAFEDKPLTQSDLENKFRSLLPSWPPAKRKEMVMQLVNSGRIRSHKSSLFWLPSLEDQSRAHILKSLDEGLLTHTEIDGLLIDWPKVKRTELVEQLIKEKRVYKVPSVTGKSELFSARANPTLQEYVKLALQLAVTKLEPLGFTSEQFFTAVRELLLPSPSEPRIPDSGQLILDRMIRINSGAANGAPISISELRFALSSEITDKGSFDQAVLRLAEQNVVALQRHTFPSSLSQEERNELVTGPDGNFYTVISFRV